MLQYQFFVLLEAHEVEVQVFNSIFFQQITTQQMAQVNILGKRTVRFI